MTLVHHKTCKRGSFFVVDVQISRPKQRQRNERYCACEVVILFIGPRRFCSRRHYTI